MMTPEQRSAQRVKRRRLNDIGRLVLSLNPAQMRAYHFWQRMCRKHHITITPQERLDWLRDCKEMPQ